MAFARAEGLPLDRVIEILGKGAGSSWYFVHRAPFMAQGEFPAGFRLRLHDKDLRICREMAARHGAVLPVVESTLADYARLLASGHGEEDIRRYSTSRRGFSRSHPPMADRPAFYLPDFCRAQSVLAVILIAALVALLFTLARHGISASFWTDLAQISLFLLWAALGTAAVWCAARRFLSRLDVLAGSAVALALALLVTALVTEGAWWIEAYSKQTLGMEALPSGAVHLQMQFATSSSARSPAGSRFATFMSRTSGRPTSRQRPRAGCAPCRPESGRISCSTA